MPANIAQDPFGRYLTDWINWCGEVNIFVFIFQDCSSHYQAMLRKNGILISMSRKGNCYDNTMVETFIKTLKSKPVWRTVFHTRQDAENAIARYMDGFYNPVRRHLALDYLSPAKFERTVA